MYIIKVIVSVILIMFTFLKSIINIKDYGTGQATLFLIGDMGIISFIIYLIFN